MLHFVTSSQYFTLHVKITTASVFPVRHNFFHRNVHNLISFRCRRFSKQKYYTVIAIVAFWPAYECVVCTACNVCLVLRIKNLTLLEGNLFFHSSRFSGSYDLLQYVFTLLHHLNQSLILSQKSLLLI